MAEVFGFFPGQVLVIEPVQKGDSQSRGPLARIASPLLVLLPRINPVLGNQDLINTTSTGSEVNPPADINALKPLLKAETSIPHRCPSL